MKLLKLAFISVIVFSIFFYLFSLLFPSQVFVTRAINIHAPLNRAYAHVSTREAMMKWNPYVQSDSMGRFIILKETGNSIEYDLQLSSHKESGNITVRAIAPDSCEVRWTQWKRARYPWQKFTLFFQDKIFAPYFESGLMKLKELSEE